VQTKLKTDKKNWRQMMISATMSHIIVLFLI